MGRLIPISEWASGPNGWKYPPSNKSLNKYASTGQIYPRPLKQGKKWVVDEDAKFVGILATSPALESLSKPVSILVKKVLHGGQTT